MDFEQQLSLMVPRLLEHKPKYSNGNPRLPFAVGGFFLGVLVTYFAMITVTFNTAPKTAAQDEPVQRTMYVLDESALSSAKRTGDALCLTKKITLSAEPTSTVLLNPLSYYER